MTRIHPKLVPQARAPLSKATPARTATRAVLGLTLSRKPEAMIFPNCTVGHTV